MKFFGVKDQMPLMVVVSVALHLVVLIMFVFTFPLPKFSARPYFVFLGAFLSDVDMLTAGHQDVSHQNILEQEKFNLDVRKDSSARQVNKPELSRELNHSSKIQYKPLMKKDSDVEKYRDNLNELGIELTPFKPVKMKLERDDPD